jgi:hypothetical protein
LILFFKYPELAVLQKLNTQNRWLLKIKELPPHTPLDSYRKQETDPQRLSGWFLGFMTAILKKKIKELLSNM